MGNSTPLGRYFPRAVEKQPASIATNKLFASLCSGLPIRMVSISPVVAILYVVIEKDPAVARAYPLTDLVKLVRAYGVLAGTGDMDRVIAGEISRRWISTEVEHWVPLSSLPAELFKTQRGRDLLAAEIFGDEDIDPETIDPNNLDLQKLGCDRLINTNRLPKLEPSIHAAVLAANMLLGVRLYGSHGLGMPSLTHDMIVATMLQGTLGKAYRYNAISSADHEIIDDSYIFTWFGDAVASNLRVLSDYLQRFEQAIERNETPEPPPSPEVATAVAAIEASRLRLTARAAGDEVISFLDTECRQELIDKGIDVNNDFPEEPFLKRDYERTLIAFGLTGVDHYALREPLRNTLLMAVRDALDDPTKRGRLSGRRGKAVHEVHMNLPIMEYYVAADNPNSIETVHLATLEMMRSLEKGRRKSLSTMSAHAFRIAAIAERVLGRALEPLIVTLAMLHDVVEDGSLRVTGYGHSLRKIQFRFGGPVAAMVSELTDSNVPTDGVNKAATTLNHPHLIPPQAQYNFDSFSRTQLKPTEASLPYTLSGIVIKLLDTVVSLEEGIRDPELMTGHWRNSGARIYWAEQVRGAIVYPLIERLLLEIKASQIDPKYSRRPHSVNNVRLRAGTALLDTILLYLDLYVTQNLAILALEYGLDPVERDTMISLFNDPNVNDEQFESRVLVDILDDQKLLASIQNGVLECVGHSTLYKKDAAPGSARDNSTFKAYRESALRRQAIRRELQLDSADKISALELRKEQVLRRFDQTIEMQTGMYKAPDLASAV